MHSNVKNAVEEIARKNCIYFRDYVPVEDKYFELINSLVSDGMRVLDFGAGPDFEMGKRLENVNVELFSTDADSVTLERNPNNRKVLSDGESIPFQDEYFDMIAFKYVFEHLERPGSILTECRRCLKPGGYIAFLCPNSYSYVSCLGRIIPLFLRKRIRMFIGGIDHSETFPTFYRLNSTSRIIGLMKEAGFEAVHLESCVGYPTYWEFSRTMHTIFCYFHKIIERLPVRSFDISLVGVFRKISDSTAD
jgi:SAM-dependent methyltransferase